MARSGGGGIFSQTFTDCQAEFYLINSTFVHNSAKEGGALSISDTKIKMTLDIKETCHLLNTCI